MLNTIVTLSLVATAVMAQNNPLIPQGISQGCTDFFTSLNSDSGIQSCAQSFISATQGYGPGSSSTPTAAGITSTLSTLCANSNSCPDSLIHGKLVDFYSKCNAELTSNPNKDVQRTYDVLYVMTPMKQAVCSKDDNGKYCVTETGGSSSSAGGNNLIETPNPVDPKYLVETSNGTPLSKRDQVALFPNTTTYAASNLPFLFLQPTMSSDTLCKTCTRNIMTSYINFEASMPYGPGISNSQLLAGQSALYNAIQNTCGKNFLSGSVAAAGGLSGGVLGSGSSRTVSLAADSFFSVVGSLALGLAAVL